VGHLANNSAEKGTIDLLKAAEQCWSRGEQFRLALAGPVMPNFHTFWARYAAKERVIRLGVLNDEQKRNFFAGIDLFALPSRTDSFGLVLLEAWANGKPNLVYRAGGPGELVHNGRDGLQAPCGDIDALAKQLYRLVRDAELRQALGQRGRERISREFRWKDKLELVQRTLVEGRKRCLTQKRSVCVSEPLTATSE
jgi:glycosyltransferase involved in cell wall biosynthesis